MKIVKHFESIALLLHSPHVSVRTCGTSAPINAYFSLRMLHALRKMKEHPADSDVVSTRCSCPRRRCASHVARRCWLGDPAARDLSRKGDGRVRRNCGRCDHRVAPSCASPGKWAASAQRQAGPHGAAACSRPPAPSPVDIDGRRRRSALVVVDEWRSKSWHIFNTHPQLEAAAQQRAGGAAEGEARRRLRCTPACCAAGPGCRVGCVVPGLAMDAAARRTGVAAAERRRRFGGGARPRRRRPSHGHLDRGGAHRLRGLHRGGVPGAAVRSAAFGGAALFRRLAREAAAPSPPRWPPPGDSRLARI